MAQSRRKRQQPKQPDKEDPPKAPIITPINFGKKLLAEAEKIAKENGYDKMVVISAVGVRGYYQKLGYELEGVYMVKKM